MGLVGAGYTLSCDVEGCGVSITVDRPMLPPGWTEDHEGNKCCPLHEARVVIGPITDPEKLAKRRKMLPKSQRGGA